MVIIIAISISILSCAKSDDHLLSLDCNFVQDDDSNDGYISEEERNIMDDCFATRLSDASDVRNNLIGEWKLIGHGEGWVPKVSQPCISFTITEFELIFNYNDGHLDTMTTHIWDIETSLINTPASFSHRINTTPDLSIRMGITTFCDQYMYGDSTPSDGNMYLFEKVR